MEEAAAEILLEFEDKLEKAMHHMVEQLKTIRTGRAAPALDRDRDPIIAWAGGA